MDFYERKRRAKIDLNVWLNNVSRKPFIEFANDCFDKYGLDATFIEKKVLNIAYPDLEIVDGQPCKVKS